MKKTKDAERRQAAYVKNFAEEKETYTKEEVADIVRDAVANFAREVLAKHNMKKDAEVYSLLEGVIRCSTIYDDEDDDDFWD